MTRAPRRDARLEPFDLGRGSLTALLVHGFTGTPFEMRFLGGHLARRGFRAVGVRLPGHGLDPYELEGADAMDWVNDAREALLGLPAGRPLFLAGLSMGALVCAILAAEHPERVTGVALFAPALRLRLRTTLLLHLASVGPLRERIRFVEKRRSGLVDTRMQEQMPVIDRIPTRAAAQFEKVQALARLALPRLQAPVLVVYSEADGTVPPEAARECAARVGSRPVRTVRLFRSSHVLTLDVERERVAEEVERFFKALA